MRRPADRLDIVALVLADRQIIRFLCLVREHLDELADWQIAAPAPEAASRTDADAVRLDNRNLLVYPETAVQRIAHVDCHLTPNIVDAGPI